MFAERVTFLTPGALARPLCFGMNVLLQQVFSTVLKLSNIVTCLLRAGIVKPAEATVAWERLHKQMHWYAVVQWTSHGRADAYTQE
jgi:hypothetical protein